MLTSFLLFAPAPLYQCILRSRFCACAVWPCTFVLAPFAFASLRLHLRTSVFALPSRLRLYACTLGTCAFELVPFALASFLRFRACAFCACDFTLRLCAFRFCACVLRLRLLRLRLAWCACALLLTSRYVWLVGWLAVCLSVCLSCFGLCVRVSAWVLASVPECLCVRVAMSLCVCVCSCARLSASSRKWVP
jgi:hypothetical protein